MKSGPSILNIASQNMLEDEQNDWNGTPQNLKRHCSGQEIWNSNSTEGSIEEKLSGMLTTMEELANRLSRVDIVANQILQVLTTLEDSSSTEGSTQMCTTPTVEKEWCSSTGAEITKTVFPTRSSKTSRTDTFSQQSMNLDASDSDHHTW